MSDILHYRPSGARSLIDPTLFAALTPDQRKRLRSQGTIRRFAAGQIIQQHGDLANGFWVIDAGQVSAGRFEADGTFDAIALLGPGDSYGELALLANRPRAVDAVAASDVMLLHVPRSAFDRLLADDPRAARALLAGLAVSLQEMLGMVALMRRSRGGSRIAQLLLTLAGENTDNCTIAITQEALADLAGTSRMTVSETLRAFANQGLVRRGYGRIEILDREGLGRAGEVSA